MQNLNSDDLRRQLDENNESMNTLTEDNQKIVELLAQRGLKAIEKTADKELVLFADKMILTNTAGDEVFNAGWPNPFVNPDQYEAHCRMADWLSVFSEDIRLPLERRAETAKPEAGEEGVDQAQDEINKLRAENEKLRLQLSACGVAAMANTVDSAEEMRCISPDLKSGSWKAVCEAVNREMYYRDHIDALIEADLVANPLLQVNLKQLKKQRDLLLDALTPQVLEWVRCGLAANGRLQDGDHPALANLRAVIASCEAVQND